MQILTLDNRTYTLEKIPEWVDEKLRFAVLDNSDPANPDFFYIPLIFLESFNSPAAVLEIGKWKIKMPLDWKMLIGEAGQSEMHVLPITSLNDRGFNVFQFNPLSSYSPSFLPIEILDIYPEVTWYAPRLKNGQFLCVPIDEGEKPRCIYFVKEISRNCEIVDYNQVY